MGGWGNSWKHENQERWDKWDGIKIKSVYTMKEVTEEWDNLQNRRKFVQIIHLTVGSYVEWVKSFKYPTASKQEKQKEKKNPK